MPIPVNEYEALAGKMLSIYDEAELVMLRRVVKRLLKGVDSPGWTERKYAEVSDVRRQLSELLDGLTPERGRIASGAVETAYQGAANWFFADAQEYAASIGVAHISPSAAKVAAILADLNMKFEAADRMILRQANDVYADVIGESAALMATGTITAREAVQRAVTALADRGITSFMDSAGRRWSMGTYAEMATLTAISNATIAGYTDTMQNYGYDLAIISSHEDACPICAAWQGVVVSVSGRDGRHLSLDDARAAGVFHPRCLHHISIYREGITHGEARDRPRPVQDAGGGYTARSRLRTCERQIRRYKRRQAAATSPQEERVAKAYVSRWQKEARRVIEEAPTLLIRHYDREGGTVRLSEAAKKLKTVKLDPL
ncbi:MAG: phage minor capsid protein [Aristaeellaceae bacterium]